MSICRYIYLIILLLSADVAYCRNPTINHLQRDSSRKQLNFKDFDQLVSRYRYYKPDSAIYFAEKGIAFSKQCKNDSGVAVMLNQLGMIDDNFGRFAESRQKYLQARSIYQRAGNAKGIAVETVRLGVVELRKGNYDKAIDYFFQSLKVSEQSNNTAGRMEAYLTLAEGYMGQHKYDIALKYLKTAEQLNNDLPFSNLSLNIYNNFGVIYRETADYKQAIKYLEKGISLSKDAKYQGLSITLTNNLAKVYSKLGDKQYSIRLQKEALAKARAIHNYLREQQTLTGLANTYGKENPAMALYYLQQALNLVRQKGAHKQEIEILEDMAELYRYQNNYQAAYKFKDEEHALADSFFYQGMSKQIASLQAAYELHQSKAKLQELKYINSQSKLQRNVIFIIAISCLLILIVVAYSLYRSSRLNKLLNKVNTDLQETNMVKDKLFSVLGHDLRSPFASIIDLLYFINDDDITADERRMMLDKLAITSSASLETLNMLLRWGQMQIKGVKLNPDNVKPKLVVERSMALLSNAADKKQIQVRDFIKEGLELITDPDHFEFVMRNLLSNAIKFTPQGGVISVGADMDTTNVNLVFWVKDTGVGIEPERLDKVFNISSESTLGTNNETGTSLGLVMCKEFIEANKGTIWVESEVGKGSTFKFLLPYINDGLIDWGKSAEVRLYAAHLPLKPSIASII